jgi:polyisoprenoid-binding protein YceI
MTKLAMLILLSVLAVSVIGGKIMKAAPDADERMVRVAAVTEANGLRYRINAGQSRFTAEAFSGGLLWFMGHNHLFAVRDFTGEAHATADTLAPASLQMRVKAGSLEETHENFTPQQKQIINTEARDKVLEADKYPEITFTSSEVSVEKSGENQYKAKITGDLTLHGVTRRITIPALVTIDNNTLRASGEFSINRSDYNVKTESIKGGLVRIRNRVKFSFDMVANRV